MRRVVFSDRGVADIAQIEDYIAGDKPGAALRRWEWLYAAAQALEHFTERGVVVSRHVRQLSTVWPYVIRYRILRDGTVSILSVRHGSRRR